MVKESFIELVELNVKKSSNGKCNESILSEYEIFPSLFIEIVNKNGSFFNLISPLYDSFPSTIVHIPFKKRSK